MAVLLGTVCLDVAHAQMPDLRTQTDRMKRAQDAADEHARRMIEMEERHRREEAVRMEELKRREKARAEERRQFEEKNRQEWEEYNRATGEQRRQDALLQEGKRRARQLALEGVPGCTDATVISTLKKAAAGSPAGTLGLKIIDLADIAEVTPEQYVASLAMQGREREVPRNVAVDYLACKLDGTRFCTGTAYTSAGKMAITYTVAKLQEGFWVETIDLAR